MMFLASLIIVACTDPDESAIVSQLQQMSVSDVNTGLAKVLITTPDEVPITSKENWINGATVVVYNVDESVDYFGTTSIKGRGNSTWDFPKKPYNLKLDKKATILGMAKHKRWCLLANWMDRTMMRNAVALEIARQMPGLSYTPHGEFVELFVNGCFQGNYFLCEHVKVDEKRLNINELDEDATSGRGITGGYLFEIDSHFDELFRFYSTKANLPWQLKDPDEVNGSQFEYAKEYVAEIEDALYDYVRFERRDFARLMDLESFVDYWLVQELTQNEELKEPNSVFLHKDIDEENGTYARLTAGPVWDFDYGTFNPDLSQQFSAVNEIYYARLFQDREFRNLVKQRWGALTAGDKFQEHICEYIDQQEQLLEASDKLNSAMWPISNITNHDTYIGFHDAVKRIKKAFCNKCKWLDYAISRM